MQTVHNKRNLLTVIKDFPVGTPFEKRMIDDNGNVIPTYGWITGLSVNSINELIFRVRWATEYEETKFHPCFVFPIDDSYSAVQEREDA
jgi:hypothetical protein